MTPLPNQSAIFVGSVVGILNVYLYTSPAPPPCRRDIIFDLKADHQCTHDILNYFFFTKIPIT